MSQGQPFQNLSFDQLIDVFSLTKTATAIHVGEDAYIQFANDAMLRVWGKDKGVIGKSLAAALPELEGQPFIDMFKKVWNEGLIISGTDTPADLELDGKLVTVYFDFEYRAVKDTNGQVMCILHTAVDVTDRFLKTEFLERAKEKEEALLREQALNEELAVTNEELESVNEELKQSQESLYSAKIELEDRVEQRTRALSETENRFRTMVEQSPVPMLVTVGADIHFDVVNQPMLDLLGKDRSIIGKPWIEGIPELKGQEILDHLKSTYTSGKEWAGNEVPIVIHKNGEPTLGYYNLSYTPLTDNGQTFAMLQSAIDVTEMVQARKEVERVNEEQQALNEELATSNEELAVLNEELSSTNEELYSTQESLQDMIIGLAESDLRFRSLVEQAPIAITVLKTTDLIIDIVNDQMLAIWGKTEDIKGKPLAEAMPELEGQPFIQILQNTITTGVPYYAYENKAHIIRYGERIEGYFNFICQPIKDANGTVDSVLQVVTEITEQVEARLNVQKAEEMVRMAVEAAQLGSWNIDPVTKALQYNDTLARIFGYEGEEPMTYEQAIGQVSDEHRERILHEIDKAINDGGNYDITYSQRRFNDNQLVWLRSSGKITADENGDFAIFSGVVMDITEQKRDEIRKNDFIGMVSHELKTPLTSLNAYLQVMQMKARKAEDSFSSGALDQSLKQVKRMTTMINGFLNVSRLESGKISIDKTTFDMADLVKETEQETIGLYATHKIIFHPVERTIVSADRDKIGQVINNFISNAIKYSRPDSTIQVACVTIEGRATVSVTDEGIGIGETDLKQLFDRYYRVQNVETKHISGFGIGLYLSAEIIERHNGKIWAESTPGKGSIFYFTLPVV